MATEIAVHKSAKSQPIAPRPARDWDLFRSMRDLLRWDPFAEIAPVWPKFGDATFTPDFDVKEKKEEFQFSADVPGIAEKDLQVQLAGNRLTVSGKRESEKSEQNETYYSSERSYGSFTRVFTLPDGIDSDRIRAELKNGVLSITIPKRPEAQAKTINVATR